MEPIFGLPLQIPPRSSRGRLRALHGQLRTAILEGRLQPGLRLPPTRALAQACEVSRNTVMAAYDLLLSEGYLVARQGSGTYVANVLPDLSDRARMTSATRMRSAQVESDSRLCAFWRRAASEIDIANEAARERPRFDFRLGVPDLSRFPMEVWRRLSARALRAFGRTSRFHWQPHGLPVLREAIAKYVSFARAVSCRPDDVTVTAGAQQAFDLLARILVTPGRTVVAVENPGYRPARAAFAAAGAKIIPVPVDAEGLVVARLPRATKVVCVTPSHQFPLGVVMSASRRAALLEFAHARGAVVIEDDYDAEFRFGGRPLDALQTLDRSESVFYVGTFSKSLFPAIRLGFAVAPAWAHRALGAIKLFTDWQCAPVAQDALAAFINEGYLAHHVRRMRRIYGVRRELLLDGLHKELGAWLEPVPALAGLHVAALSTTPLSMPALVERARQQDVGLYSLDRFGSGRSVRPGLVFGYGSVDEPGIQAGLARLRRICAQMDGAPAA